MPRYLLFLFLCSTACGGSAAARYTYNASMIRQSKADGEAAARAMLRESQDLRPFSAKVEALDSVEFLAMKAPKIKEDGGRIVAEVQIGKDATATCILETHAERAMDVFSGLRARYREDAERYELKFDRTVSESGERFRVVHEAYSGEDGKVTFVKFASTRTNVAGAVCLHEGYGYRETLDRVFAHMVATATGPSS